MKSETNKNDRRAVRSRKWLQDALLELIKEKPFAEINVKQITDRADVSRQTMYGHYYNKRDLLYDLLDREFLQFRDSLLEKAQKEPFDTIKVSDHIFSFWLERIDSLRPLLAEDVDERLIRNLRGVVSEIVVLYAEQHNLSIDIRVSYIADFLSGGAFAMLQRWSKNPEEISPPELADLVGRAAEALKEIADENSGVGNDNKN